jgi:sugar phosphate isomerase/epimerase
VKIGLSMLYCLRQPFQTLLKELENLDVQYVEIVDEGAHTLDEVRADAVRKIALDKGFTLTVHSPFINTNIIAQPKSARDIVIERLKQSLRLSSKLDSSLWVFHPGMWTGTNHFTQDSDWKANINSVKELLSTAEEYGVKITIENGLHPLPFLLKTAEDFTRFYADVGDIDLGLTFDVGHANVNHQVYAFLKQLPSMIVHTHLHDNHGKRDEHLGLGKGTINWPRIISTFKKMDYKGILLIESEKDVQESLQTLRTLVETV